MFFANELAGEPSLELVTAERLVAVSQRLDDMKFWTRLPEERIVALAGETEVLYVQATGALGEFRSVTVYRGQRGLRYLNNLMDEVFEWHGEALESHDLIRVRFAARKDLRAADQALLEALGVPKVRGRKVPEFSSSRPGFHDWHVNDAEGRELARALEILERFLTMAERIDGAKLWPDPDFCPYLTEDSEGHLMFQQVPLDPGDEPAERWEAPSDWPGKPLRNAGDWEMGQFCASAMLGEKSERKGIFCATAVMDAKRGTAHALQASAAHGPRLPALWAGFLKAVGTAGHLPKSLAVSRNDHAAMLRPVAERLGFTLAVKPRLEALEQLRHSLLLSMGETPFGLPDSLEEEL